MAQFERVFGLKDGAMLRRAFDLENTPPAILDLLAAATARADASISEADKLYFPATFKPAHKEAARKLVAAIFSSMDRRRSRGRRSSIQRPLIRYTQSIDRGNARPWVVWKGMPSHGKNRS
jgi:hypothetical protein